ncbi:MAG: hypothetical protein NVV66_17270 [Cellulomonas sp.]|uniref:hypothetical protein n=1 Tax=Cellulomonas sp. TaxID=40001 RepID=UPI002587982E|nr:hypothetical protein [Cellulomonas sp.]MCR6706356.1 hypothetical protein [Cellulomonas sp.]
MGVLCGLLGAAWVGVWLQQLPELSWDAVMAELSRKPVSRADLEATGTLLPPESVPGGGGMGGPEPGHEEAAAPLGAPAPVDWDGAPYAFLSTQARPDGLEVPVTWSPCRPVHYVVNSAGAPVGFADDVATVVAELADATGFVFVDDGPTDESAGPDRPIYQPERYGRRWAPLLVQFSDETLQPRARGPTSSGAAGRARSPATTGCSSPSPARSGSTPRCSSGSPSMPSPRTSGCCGTSWRTRSGSTMSRTGPS